MPGVSASISTSACDLISASLSSFVTQYDELQLLEIVRPTTQDSELQNSPKCRVAEREEHAFTPDPRWPSTRPDLRTLHPEVRSQNRLTLSKMTSAVAVQTKGVQCSL